MQHINTVFCQGVSTYRSARDVPECNLLQCPVQLSPGKKVGYPSDRGISQDHRNKTRFMLLYYSYSRPLREARGNHCHTFMGRNKNANNTALELRELHALVPNELQV